MCSRGGRTAALLRLATPQPDRCGSRRAARRPGTPGSLGAVHSHGLRACSRFRSSNGGKSGIKTTLSSRPTARSTPMDLWRTPVPPLPTGRVPVPSLPKALARGVVVERPGHDVRGGRADLLIAAGAPVDLGRGRSGDRAHRPVTTGPRLHPLGRCGRTRIGAPRRLVSTTTGPRTHPTTVSNIQRGAELVSRLA